MRTALLSGVAASAALLLGLAVASVGAQTFIGATTSPGGISAICDLLAIDNAADCALITRVESKGDAPWYVDDNRWLRSGDIDHDQNSCLHIFATLPDARRLSFRMSASSEPFVNFCRSDTLSFRYSSSGAIQARACGASPDDSAPREAIFRQDLSARDVELIWCYSKNNGGIDGGQDAGWLHELSFIKSSVVEDVAGVVDAVTSTEKISDICEFATGTNAADCALISKIESQGDASWYVSDDLRLRSGDIDHDQSSCLHIAATLPNERRLDIRMAASSEGNIRCYDGLHFRLPPSDDSQAAVCGPGAGISHDLHFHKELSAGAVEFSLCYEKDGSDDGGEDAGWLRRLRFIEPRPAIELTLPEWIQGEVADIAVLMRMRDNYGNAFYKDADAALVAELEGGAVFVDAAGIVTDTVSIAQGVELRRSLSVRLDAATATLKIALQSGGVSTNLEVTLLTASNSRQKQEMCSALDISDADCARLSRFVTAGGGGRVMAGVIGGDAAFAWSVVSSATATGGSALGSAALADSQHSCLGFDVRLSSAEFLSFDWRVSSQSGDTLSLWVDGQSDDMDAISGDVGEWHRHLRELEAGDRRIRWCYEKNAADSAGDDAAWLDNMRLEPSRPQLKLSVNSSSTLGASTDLFPQVTMNLGLRLTDQFGRILPLSSLFESGSLQPKLIAGESARQILRLEPIHLLQIMADATLYEWDASFFLPWVSEGDLALVVETAALTLASNPVPLPSSSGAEKVCAAASVSDADCALISTISESGDLPWYIEEIDGVDVLRSGDISHLQQSCLHLSVNIPKTRMLDFRLDTDSEAGFDFGVFRLNNFSPDLVDTGRDNTSGMERGMIDGRPGIVRWHSGVTSTMQFRERLTSGKSDLSWCYQKDDTVSVGLDESYLRSLKFPELELELTAPSELELRPGENTDVMLSIRLRDDLGAVVSETVEATLVAELEGAAEFVIDGVRSGTSLTRMLALASDSMVTALSVRPTSNSEAMLRLTLSVDGLSATATVSFRTNAQPVVLERLAIDVQDEVEAPAPFAAFDMALTLRALDNYDDVWSQSVDATLTAELTGAAEFVDDAGGGIGNMRTIPVSIMAGGTMTTLRARLSSSADATLSLSLSADGATRAEAEVDLLAADGVLTSLTIETLEQVPQRAPLEDIDVAVSLKAFDSYGDSLLQAVAATLTAELTGGAMLVDAAGIVIGERDTEAISIMTGEATHSLRVRLAKAVDASLALALVAEGRSASATVSLIAVPAAPMTLTIVALEPEPTANEPFDMAVLLGVVDNYGRTWREDVAATLTAELIGEAVFVDGVGVDAGTNRTDTLSIRMGELAHSVRLRRKSDAAATLRLTLSAAGLSDSVVDVNLPSQPRVLRALQLTAQAEVEQMAAGEAVAVTFQLAAFDNYDDAFAARVALVAQALDSHFAQVQLVGEALSSSGSFLIAGGEAAVVVEALPSPGRDFSLQLEVRAGDISERAVTRIVAAVSADSRLLAEGPSQLVLDADGRGGFDFILRAVDAAGTSNVEVQGVRLGVAENARVSVSFDTTSTLDLTTEPLNIRVTVELAGLNDAELALLVTHDTLIDGELLVRLLRGPETLDVTQDQKLDTEDLIVIARYLQDASLDADHLLRNLKMPSADAAVVIETLNRLRMDMALDLDGDGDGDGVDVRLLLRYGLGLGEALLSADFDEAKARALLSGQ